MSESNLDLRLEIAHVLFIDIVGYSKLLINEQHEMLQKLNQIVRGTEAFQRAEAAGKEWHSFFQPRQMRQCNAHCKSAKHYRDIRSLRCGWGSIADR